MSTSRRAGIPLLVLGVAGLGLTMLWDSLLFGRAPSIGRQQLLASVPAFLTIVIGTALSAGWTLRFGRVSTAITVGIGIGATLCSGIVLSVAVERGGDFPYDRTTGAQKVLARVKSLGLSNTRLCRCAPDRTARIALPGGFTTRLSIFDKGGRAPRRGVLIAHGNTWLGSDLSTYRILARSLADRGYIVAAVDFPGFGRADDPFGRGWPAVADAYDRPAVLTAAIDWLLLNTDVDSSDITLLGHSGGVDWAMRVGVTHANVSRVAAMVAPPPAVIDGNVEDGTPEYALGRSAYFSTRFADQYEFVYGRPVPGWYTWELAQPNGRFGDDAFSPYARPAHKPLLLVLGERDQPDGHESVRERFGSLTEPKELLLLRHSDHYLNTAQSLGLVFYDRRVAHALLDGLHAWIERT